MQVSQIYQLTNTVTREVIGDSVVVNEDLSNVVDVGTAIFNGSAFDNYVKTLINHIGKVIFVDRPYRGSAPSVLMDSWEYGSILEKVSSELPVATENKSWDLVDGQSYDPHVFHKPVANAKFYNHRNTLQVERSITKRQVKESFSSATQLNGFISMLFNETEKALTIRMDSLVMRVINNMIANTIKAEYGTAQLSSKSGVRAVNLLFSYNQHFSKSLTAAQALTDPDFIRYAAFQMGLYSDRLTRMSTLFNTGNKARFTPKDLQHVVMLSEFASAADVYLQADTWHNEYTKLLQAERVPFWQGSGSSYAFADTSKIMVTPSDGTGTTDEFTAGGILGIMFDREALGVTNYDRRVETEYNPVAEFTNYWYKMDVGYFNDENENFVVFFVA